jgi:type IV secretory pathway VirB4 component
MANVTLKKEESKTSTVEEGCVAIVDSSDGEDIFDSFHSLELVENDLTEQKENLKALLNQLETKAKEKIERKKRKVERLNSEVTDLKRKCEKIAKWVNSENLGA